jgi:hypothetical protein
MPLANWYANAAGYRKLGLRYAHQAGRRRQLIWIQGTVAMCMRTLQSCADIMDVLEAMI